MDEPDSTAAPGLDGSTVVSASDTVLASPLGGEVVLLEPEAGIYYSLNEVGARIWEIIRDPVSVESVWGQIAREYDVDPAQAEADVLRLLSELVEHGLAETRTPSE
jgi:hypothetical protein